MVPHVLTRQPLTWTPPLPHDDPPVAHINTTPLVDVMLVLLIIFLITLPVLSTHIRVQLPRATTGHQAVQTAAVVISIDAQGQLYWQNQRLTGAGDLLARLRSLAQHDPQASVHIYGDASGQFAPISAVLDACAQAGLDGVAIITQVSGARP